ncbi:MAG: sigma factor-like helix-turn-helix DNA-binding protein, partial [Candidatus Thorarchaeota archaeon]
DLRIAMRERRLTLEESGRLYREFDAKTHNELRKTGLSVEKFIRKSCPEPDPSEVYRLYYEERLSQKNVAKKLGVTEWSVRKVFKKYGLETRSIEGVHSDVDHSSVCQLYFEEGWTQRDIAEMLGLTEWSVRRILSSPRVEALEDPLLATLSDTTEMIEFSRAEYLEAVRRNPELRLMRSFDRKHHDVLAYFDLKDLLAKGEVDHVEFARERGIYYGKVAKWAQDVKQPTMLAIAYDCELRRLYKEAHGSLPEVEPDIVHEDRVEYEQKRIIREWARTAHLERLLVPKDAPEAIKDRPALTQISLDEVEGILESYTTPVETLTELVEFALRRSSRVSCIDLSEVESWKLRALRETFASVPEAVEWAAMEKVGGDPFRIGLVDDILYVWRPDSSFFNLMNIYRGLYFYFNDRNEIAQFILDIDTSLSSDNLGLRETVDHLEELIMQMFPDSEEVMLANDKGRDYRILGKHLHLLSDISGITPSQLESRVFKITNSEMGHGGIMNPKFLEGEELEIALARLAATILCDGHIQRKGGSVSYSESNTDRIDIFERDLGKFGDIELSRYWDKRDDLYSCYISSGFGTILKYIGLAAGDKTILNPQLRNEFIEGLSWKALCALIEDTIPEDGTVNPGRIRCSHSVALHAGDKTEKYGMTPLVGEAEIELIKSKGNRDDDALVDCWSLPFGRLTKLTLSRDSGIASVASNLHDVTMGNPSNFILAEQRALQRLDVESTRNPVNVSFYRKSGRVSVSWQWTVSGDDAVKLAILAPPNDVVKRGILRSWLKRIPARVKEIISDLEQKEIQFEYWWIKE